VEISFVASILDRIIYIKTGKTSIGRKGCDIELNDQSLSRTHANLFLSDGVLKLEDVGSKYGTFINDKRSDEDRVQPNQLVELQNGDRVLFGRMENEWIVHYREQKTAFSMLPLERKAKLSPLLQSLNVKVSESFDSTCTHLTMPSQTDVSIKLIEALIACTSIVTPKYWNAVQISVANNQPLPKAIDFTPNVKEEGFVTSESISLAVNENRKKLFAGKTVVFTSSALLKVYEALILKAGGKAVSLSSGKMTTTQCCAKNTIVIHSRGTGNTQSQNESAITKLTGKKPQLNYSEIN
jgi:hypothetical protein